MNAALHLTSPSNHIGFECYDKIHKWALTFSKDSEISLEVCKIIVNQYVNNPLWCYNCFKSSHSKSLYTCLDCKQAKYCSEKCYQQHQKYHFPVCYDATNPSICSEIEEIQASAVEECLDRLQTKRDVVHYKLTVEELKRIRDVCLFSPDTIELWESENLLSDFSSMVRIIIYNATNILQIYSKNDVYKVIKSLWALPGMPELILHENIVPEVACQNIVGLNIWCQFWIPFLVDSTTHELFRQAHTLSGSEDKVCEEVMIPATEQMYTILPMLRLAFAKQVTIISNEHFMSNLQGYVKHYEFKILTRQSTYIFSYVTNLKEHGELTKRQVNMLVNHGLIDGILSILSREDNTNFYDHVPQDENGRIIIINEPPFGCFHTSAVALVTLISPFLDNGWIQFPDRFLTFHKMFWMNIHVSNNLHEAGAQQMISSGNLHFDRTVRFFKCVCIQLLSQLVQTDLRDKGDKSQIDRIKLFNKKFLPMFENLIVREVELCNEDQCQSIGMTNTSLVEYHEIIYYIHTEIPDELEELKKKSCKESLQKPVTPDGYLIYLHMKCNLFDRDSYSDLTLFQWIN